MPTILFTRREAAEIGGVPLRQVDKAIEQRVVRVRRVKQQPMLAAEELGVLALLNRVPAGLSVQLKRRVRNWLVALGSGPHSQPPELAVSDAVFVRATPDVLDVLARAERYSRLRDRWIVRDPGIKGGEPVIRGSRISVYHLAKLIELGETAEVLAEDFPHVPAEAREVAVQYAKAHPRRGRPRRPWLDE